MNSYRNYLTYVANNDLALDLRPLTVIVGPHDERKRETLEQLHQLRLQERPISLEVHNLLQQFQLGGTFPHELEKLVDGRFYDSLPLHRDAAVRHPKVQSGTPGDPGERGETLFACFAAMPDSRRRLIMGHLKQVFGNVSFEPIDAPTHWHEADRVFTLENLPGNRLHFLWLLCALYDQHPLKLFHRPELGLKGLPKSAVNALVDAFRNGGALGQVIVVTYHSDIISALAPEEMLLVPSSKRQAVWGNDLDPELFEDKHRLIRYTMGLAA